MEILKGKVQDPGFPDTEITYLKTDDGKTYFFVENGTLKNGNYIATPNLKEGIGHAPYTSLGVINQEGNVLIPFENKNIQVLSNELLLVERNKPVTESVVNALQKQSDPLAASELVENANTIKSQITSVMGSNGNFVFDNQFSEAALYTTDGVNLGNNYFSFIGAKDGAYFMSANVVGSPIAKYDPYAFAMDESQNQTPEKSEQVENTQDTTQTEVTNEEQTAVDSNIENSIENSEGQSVENPIPSVDDTIAQPEIPQPDIPQENVEQPSVDLPNQNDMTEQTIDNQEQADINIPLTPELPQPDITPEVPTADENTAEETPSQDMGETVQEQSGASQPDLAGDINIPLFAEGMPTPQEGEQQIQNSDAQEQPLPSLDDEGDNQPEENNSEEEINENENQEEIPVEEDIEEETTDEEVSDEPEEEYEETENSEYSEEDDGEEYESEEDSSDEESNEEEYEESNDSSEDGGFENEEEPDEEQENYQSEDEKYYEENLDNPIIASATDTIKKLLDENRKQRQQLDQQESDLYTLKTNNEILQEDNAAKTQEINSLRRVHENDRKNNIDLLRENNKLKAANIRQDEIIDTLKQQNAALKEQVAGISALNNAVMEANTMFGSEVSDDYGYLGETEGYQYQKAA